MEISLVKLAVWKQAVPDLQHVPISSGNCNINADASLQHNNFPIK